MEAKIQNLAGLFEDPISYRIPVFQRPYAWGKEQQWKPLWNDTRNMAEKILDPRSPDKIPPHFMGAIVLQLQSAKTGEVVKRIVVDGQQRLTTLQLLIKAAQESFQSVNDVERANKLAKLTQNEDEKLGGDLSNQTKVRQSNVNDLEAFQNVIRGSSDDDSPLRSIGQASRYFKQEITDWLNGAPAERDARAGALETTLTKHLQVATVDLDDNEKPHFIFTVLNARSEPLKESDHIKNTIMYEANIVDDSSKANELWGIFDRNEWWRKETKEGRLTRIHLDRFLNYWIVMSLGRDVSADHVSSEFNNHVDVNKISKALSIEEIATDIRSAGQVYQDMEEARLPGIEIFLRRMKVLELGVAMPPLMWLYTQDLSDEKRQRSVRALESYLVRRMLCGIHSQGLNRLFVELLARLRTSDAEHVDQAMIDFLSNQTVDNRIWPKDSLLRDHLVGVPMSGTTGRQMMVLRAVEMQLRTSKTEGLGSVSLTREHIMPESWEKNWPLPEGTDDVNEATEARSKAIKEIGNLTMVTGKLNPALSNAAWAQKRETLKQHTALRLNWELLDEAPVAWDEVEIHKRSEELATIVAQIWPFADKI